MNLSWGGSLGSQLLAEISLLEANAKVSYQNHETSARLHADRLSIVAGSIHSSTVHEEGSVQNESVDLLNSSRQHSKLSTDNNASCSTSIAGLLSSSPSEINSGTSLVLEKRTNPLSVSVHSLPLSCSTPVTIPAVSLRKASLRSSSVLKLQLQNWGLPSAVVQKYAEKKITTLFPWQVDCLKTGKVLDGSNLIYSAPTSSGKTLVSELLMLKTVVDLKKKGIEFILFTDPHNP
jgi:DNA polymerase theta